MAPAEHCLPVLLTHNPIILYHRREIYINEMPQTNHFNMRSCMTVNNSYAAAHLSALHNRAYMLWLLTSLTPPPTLSTLLPQYMCMGLWIPVGVITISVYRAIKLRYPRPTVAIRGQFCFLWESAGVTDVSSLVAQLSSAAGGSNGTIARTSSSNGRNTVMGRMVDRSATTMHPHVVPI